MAEMPKYYKIHTDGCTVELEPIYEELIPVVRCKDCKHHHDCGTHFCYRLGMDCPDDSDFFCKYGERKDGEG